MIVCNDLRLDKDDYKISYGLYAADSLIYGWSNGVIDFLMKVCHMK